MNSPAPPPLPANPLPSFLVPAALGVAAGLICWTMMPDNNLLFPHWPVAALLAGIVGGFAFPRDAWLRALLTAGGIVAGAFLGMIPGWVRDPSSNNLWPLVLGIILFLAVVPSFAGAYLGALPRKLAGGRARQGRV